MTFADLETKLDEAREGSSSDGGNDYDELPRVKLTPEAAISGTIVDVGYSGNIYAEQNIRGADDWRDSGDFIFVLENPSVERGQLFAAQLRDEAEDGLAKNLDDPYPFSARTPTRDFRVVPSDWEDADHIDESVEKIDGEYDQVGLEIYGSQYVSQPAPSFDAALDDYDRVKVFVGKQAGRMMMQGLDTSLSQSAFIRDGEKTTGMVEFPRGYGGGDTDLYPRMAADPILHPELEGADVALYLHFGDLNLGGDADDEDADDEDDSGGSNYRKHYGDLLIDDDGETVIVTDQDTDHIVDAAPDERDERDVWLEWHEPSDGWGGNGGGGSSGSDSSSGSGSSSDGESFDFDELDEGAGDDGDISLDDVDAATTEFIEQAAEYATDLGGIDEAFSSFESTVATAIDGGEIENIDVADARTLVEQEMGA